MIPWEIELTQATRTRTIVGRKPHQDQLIYSKAQNVFVLLLLMVLGMRGWGVGHSSLGFGVCLKYIY